MYNLKFCDVLGRRIPNLILQLLDIIVSHAKLVIVRIVRNQSLSLVISGG